MHDIASLIQDLFADLEFNDYGWEVLTSDLDIVAARKLWLGKSFAKKFKPNPEEGVMADRLCLDKFVDCNDACVGYSPRPFRLFHDEVFGEIRLLIASFFEAGPELTPSLRDLSLGFGVGPGASLGCASYDFYTKLYNSPLTRTNDQLHREYRCALVDDPLAFEAELLREATWGNSNVAGSRLSFVPKTREISRSICTEPVLNMLFQKGIGTFLEKRLKERFSIDLSKQPILNRKLARLGSGSESFVGPLRLGEYRKFGTIDLSSASDSISIRLIEELFPSHFVRWLKLARSPETIFPDGSKVKLGMISSMGNGFTFPLMTMIFASLVVVCYRLMGVNPQYGADGPQNFAVFGDDIIVRSDAYDFIVGCLEVFGFSVNESKSFNTGCFRESCGGDYFKGHNIRGVYIKELSHESHIYSAINRLIRWSAGTGVPLPRVVARLYGSIPACKRFVVPYTDGDAEGIKAPLEFFQSQSKVCEDSLLARADTPSRIRKAILRERTLSAVRRGNRGSVAYFAVAANTLSLDIPDDDNKVATNGGLPMFVYNGPGILHTLLGGFIRDGRVALRSSEANRTNVRRRYSSSWDWVPASGSRDGFRDFEWEFTCQQLLGDS